MDIRRSRARAASTISAIPIPDSVSHRDTARLRQRSGSARRFAAGVREDDRVALIAGNSASFVAARDAAGAAGVVLAPINPRLAPKEVEWVVGHARPRAILVDEAHRASALPGARVIVLDD